MPSTDPGPDEPLRKAEIQQALARCRLTLSEDLRVVVELHYFEGLDRPTIQKRLGLAKSSVNVRLFRAMQALRECMQRKGYSGAQP